MHRIPLAIRSVLWLLLSGILVNYFYEPGRDWSPPRLLLFTLICLVSMGVLTGVDYLLASRRVARVRAQLLNDHESQLVRRSVSRLELLGLRRETAQRMCKRLLNRELPEWAREGTGGKVLLLTGPLGAGKTTIAEAVLLRVIREARESRAAPIPVFLEVLSVNSPLKDAIIQRCREIGDPAEVGVVAVLDALEQASPRRMQELLMESLDVSHSWPQSTILVTSRGDIRSPDAIHSVRVPELPESEWESLAAEAAEGRQVFAQSYPKSVQEAASRPLYAILLGVWVRDIRIDQPHTPAALVQHLVHQSVGRSSAPNSEMVRCLQSLATAYVELAGSPVLLHSVPGCSLFQHALAETGMVTIDNSSRVAFPLAMFAEWFAGQALLANPDLLGNADAHRLRRWRYALTQAVAAATHAQAKPILQTVVRAAPALAGAVINDAIYDEVVPSRSGTRTGEEWAELIASAMDSWRDAMGVLARRTTPTTESGEPAAIGTRVVGPRLAYGWSRLSGRTAELPENTRWYNPRPDWRELGDRVASDESLFEWRFTWEWVAKRLEELLRNAWLPPCTDALRAEYDWHLAQLVSRGHASGFRCDPVPLETLEELIQVAANFHAAMISSDGLMVSVFQLRDVVDRHRRRHLDAVHNPWPCPDRISHWIPDMWSAERRLERLQGVSEAALHGYEVLIQEFLPAFRTQLDTRRMMPLRLRGYQCEAPQAEGRNFGRFNVMWYLEPVPGNMSSSVEWVQVDDLPTWDELSGAVLTAFAAHRPNLPAFGLIHGGFVGLECSRPAMNLLAILLWNDFRAWGWMRGTGPNLSISSAGQDLIPDDIYWMQLDHSDHA